MSATARPLGEFGSQPARLRNKVRFALVNSILVEQIFALDTLKEDTMIHQEPLRIVKTRHWVQIGCTRMDWATYDELVRQVGEDQ